MMLKPERMIEIITEKVLTRIRNETVRVRYATIDSNYSSGRPKVQFDGEQSVTLKGYPYLSSYSPIAGDRVQIINGVIQGKVM